MSKKEAIFTFSGTKGKLSMTTDLSDNRVIPSGQNISLGKVKSQDSPASGMHWKGAQIMWIDAITF